VPPAASWMGKFQDVLDGCELGNLGGAVVMRSELVSELLYPLCWRGDDQLVAAAMTPLFGDYIRRADRVRGLSWPTGRDEIGAADCVTLSSGHSNSAHAGARR
jgi:hypothetical protein